MITSPFHCGRLWYMEPKEVTVAWAAGIFEGEGCISSDSNGASGIGRRLTVVNTDLDVLEKFYKTVGVGKIEGPFHRSNRKTQWRWRCGKWEEIEHVLNLLMPHFCKRRFERAQTLLSNPPKFTRQMTDTECRNGHSLAGPNLYVTPTTGRRVCRQCRREYMQSKRAS